MVFLIHHRDGLDAAVYMRNDHCSSWAFAVEVEGRIVKNHFGQIPKPRDLPLFDGPTHVIKEFFFTGKPLYPVERTLLVTGMLVFLFESKDRSGPIESSALYVRYRAPRDTFLQ